jgi:8-oxo-dGTP pyrophosphatase MutT (NUDIX family)
MDPVEAATVVVVRETVDAIEIFLAKRSSASSVLGGAHVFPGGRVDPGDGTDSGRFLRAAIREVHEEVGVVLDAGDVLAIAHWVTPVAEPRRFNTRFFAARLPQSAEPSVDGSEIVDGAWMTPEHAIAAYRRRAIDLAPPTLVTLEDLVGCVSWAIMVKRVKKWCQTPIEPVLFDDDGVVTIAFPGDHRHPEAQRAFANRTRVVRRGERFVSEMSPKASIERSNF